MSKILTSRALWGGLLVLAGIALLLQNLGVIIIGSLLWAVLFAVAGAVFVSVFISNRHNWWGLIPGFTLIAIAVIIFLGELVPTQANKFSGVIILGAIGLSFFAIYINDRQHWWAIIPGGVMAVLALITGVEPYVRGIDMGGIFMVGVGFVFLFLAIFPIEQRRMNWAWFPAIILIVLGLIIVAAAQNLLLIIWPVVLILLGCFFIARAFFFRRNP